MVYRIRYRRQRGSGEGELVVEANSPSEAMVKFRHVHGEPPRSPVAGGDVTSVVPEATDADAPQDSAEDIY